MIYNPYSLKGKTILITGASSGIGKASAIECAKLGANVILTARNIDRLENTLSLLDGDNHLICVADLNRNEDIANLVDQIPVCDGIVSNAGLTKTLPTSFITESYLNDVLRVNTIAPILLIQMIIKKKKINKNSSIVFTSSISGNKCAVKGNVLYSISKAAIMGFVKNAALDLAPKKIRVNAVLPGMIDTNILETGVITEEQLNDERKKYPLKRFGLPQEVAWGIIYFLSDASAFVTGSELVIDGGFTLE